MNRRRDPFAIVCLVGATLSWGAVPIMLQYLRNYVPDGFTANMIRYPVASLFYLPLLIDGIIHRRGGKFWLTALLPAAINIAAQTFWGMAPYHHMDAGVISFLLRLSAIWGVLGAFLVFPDERRLARSPIFWAGTTIALGGFVIMSWAHVLGVRESGLAGLVIMFFCGLFQGLYGVAVRYVMGKLNPLFVFAVVGSYTSIGLIIMAPLGNPASLLRLPMMPWIMLLVSAVVGIGLAHGMYYVAVQRMGAAVSTLLLSVTPFVTICGSSILLNERFSPAQWIGGTILVLGATIAVRAPRNVLEITHANDSSTTEPADPHPTA